jgi:hypothetical protein
MLDGARRAAWDHTAALILVLRRVNGDKKAQFDNPYSETSRPKTLKEFFKGKPENESS